MSDVIEITLSPKTTVKIRELDGWTSSAAEAMAAGLIGKATVDEFSAKFPVVVGKVYAIGSLTEINGRPVNPLKNELEYRSTASALTFMEVNALMERFSALFSPPTADELGNEPAAPPSSP